jgi:PHD/YefM family antitoxin component YafN of YafNO toxin-antitoxin module
MGNGWKTLDRITVLLYNRVMIHQLISDQKFTNIQNAQAGLTRLFEDAENSDSFYTVLKNDKQLGVLIPNKMWNSLLEDLEAMSSENYKKRIAESRKSKTYSSDEVKRMNGI